MHAVFAAVLVTPGGCSTQNWYQGMQASHQNECMQYPESEYEECMRGTDRTYDEYTRDLQDAGIEDR
jgi:hypothetical protein